EPWTLLIPKNSGLPRGGGFLQDREATKKILLNHAVLGQVVDANNPPQRPAPVTLSGTPLIFTKDGVGPMVNGVRFTGEEYKLSEGVVYVVESSIPILDFGASSSAPTRPSPKATPPTPITRLISRFTTTPTSLPPLTHRFATFKPRKSRNGVSSNNLNQDGPIAVIPEDIEPVFGEDVFSGLEGERIESEPAFEVEFGTGFAGDFGSGAISESTFAEVNNPSRERHSADKPTFGFSEFAGSGAEPNKDKSFLESFLETIETTRAHTGSEFLHHFKTANISDRFRDAGRYTALIPYDSAFYQYYPIDWGFNPFLVANFTKDVILNHFIRGNVALEDLPSLAELTTLGGRVIKFIRKGNKLLGNGVEVVFESETMLSRGRSYVIQDLMFVDHDRIMELQAEHGDLETAPLLGDPWPTSQFLSHLLDRVQQDERTSFFSEYLNLTNLAYRLPGHDENLDPLKYTAFIPVDESIANILYADSPDPFIFDDVLREELVLNHLVKGRLYEDDLKNGMTITNLANSTLTVTRGPGGKLKIDDATVIETNMYIYNLGVMYLINGVLRVSDQDIVRSVNKLPELTLGPSKDSLPLPSLAPEEEAVIVLEETPSTTEAPITTLAPRSTSTRPSIHRRPGPSSRPGPPSRPSPSARPFSFPRTSTTPRSGTIPFSLFTTTTTTPEPTPTTPRIRVETRTEISVSRRINDGVVEPIKTNLTS
ncbi:hypothetical protein SK128_017609, partial [Halocaridina rubra]